MLEGHIATKRTLFWATSGRNIIPNGAWWMCSGCGRSFGIGIGQWGFARRRAPDEPTEEQFLEHFANHACDEIDPSAGYMTARYIQEILTCRSVQHFIGMEVVAPLLRIPDRMSWKGLDPQACKQLLSAKWGFVWGEKLPNGFREVKGLEHWKLVAQDSAPHLIADDRGRVRAEISFDDYAGFLMAVLTPQKRYEIDQARYLRHMVVPPTSLDDILAANGEIPLPPAMPVHPQSFVVFDRGTPKFAWASEAPNCLHWDKVLRRKAEEWVAENLPEFDDPLAYWD